MTKPTPPHRPTKGTQPPTRPKAPTTPPQAVPDRQTNRADRRVTLAAVTGAHGVGGEVRLKVFADDLSSHKRFNDGALTVSVLRITPQGAIARFAEVPDRTAAERLRGTELTVSRDALPPLADGEYYHADLIGLPAVTDTGEAVGTVVAIDDFGAGDVIELERPDGRRFMVPMTPVAVPEWDEARLVVADAFVER